MRMQPPLAESSTTPHPASIIDFEEVHVANPIGRSNVAWLDRERMAYVNLGWRDILGLVLPRLDADVV